MKIQLWTDLAQLKGKTYNLALMKLSAYHKKQGHEVRWHDPDFLCDILYCSKIFTDEITKDITHTTNAVRVVKGGTGYNLTAELPAEIEHIYPDYSLYPHLEDTAVGFITRGCPNQCGFCICSRKEGRQSTKVADIKEFWSGQKYIELLDPNLLACRHRNEILEQLAETKAEITFKQGLDARFITEEVIEQLKRCRIGRLYLAWDLEKFSEQIKAGLTKLRAAYPRKDYRDFIVYTLVNFNTPWEFDLERINWLKEHRFAPYVMIYEKWACEKKYKHLQRAVNNRFIFSQLKSLADYAPLKEFIKEQE